MVESFQPEGEKREYKVRMIVGSQVRGFEGSKVRMLVGSYARGFVGSQIRGFVGSPDSYRDARGCCVVALVRFLDC